MKSERIDTLEALRGMAAIIVVLWHLMLGFLPQLSGIFEAFPASVAVTGKPWFFIVNGPGAVAFFFTLSGFVLSRRAIVEDRPAHILNGAVKRWPRLALPVTITTLVSWSLFQLDLYRFEDAASMSGSEWMMHFAYATQIPIERSILDPLGQGLFLTFFRGDAYYDTSLWTMKFELFGSFVVFGLTLAALLYRRVAPKFTIIPIAVVAVMAVIVSPWYVPFVVGLALAIVLPRDMKLGTPARVIACGVGLYLLGYMQPRGAFAIFEGWSPVYVNMVGSGLLIAAAYDLHLRGTTASVARFLGALSFPLYLLHVLVICSAGSAVYVWLKAQTMPHPSLITIVVTMIISIAVSLPLIPINQYWTRRLNAWVSAAL